jgi:DNA primase
MATEGLSFPDAVEHLAHEAGLALPQASPEAEAEEKTRARLDSATKAFAFYPDLRGGVRNSASPLPAKKEPLAGL